MRILDTFTGIGGFTLGAGPDDTTIGFVEINHDCQKTLGTAFPNIPIHKDIRTFQGNEFGEFDLLTGGFPCQPFSMSGEFYRNNKTLGDDDRANLSLELIRIIRKTQPKAFLFENVSEILSIKNKDGSSFLDALLLNLQGCGYRVTYKILLPTDFGLPQKRKRVFFVGIRSDISKEFSFPEPKPTQCRVLDYMDAQVPYRFTLAHLWRKRMMKRSQGTRLDALKADYASRKLNVGNNPINKLLLVATIYGDSPGGSNRQSDRLYSVQGYSPTITTFSIPAFDHPAGWRVLTPLECARLQGFPDIHPISSRIREAYQQVGNAVCVTVVREIIKQIANTIS
jgi:DNA (cytosine-5)-methyltransferase 1